MKQLPPHHKLGEILAEGRKSKGWTKAYVKRRYGVAWDAVHKWEKGERRPQPEKLMMLTEDYGLNAAEVMTLAYGDAWVKKNISRPEGETKGYGERGEIRQEVLDDLTYLAQRHPRKYQIVVAEIFKATDEAKKEEAHAQQKN